MKLESKIVIGLLAAVALALAVVAVRSGGPAQVQIVAPDKTKADYEQMLIEAVRKLGETNAELKSQERRIAETQASLNQDTKDGHVADGARQYLLEIQESVRQTMLSNKQQQEELIVSLKKIIASM